jgi:diguanylate cyclase (GGDEF)-like protein
MPETAKKNATLVAEKIRAAMNAKDFLAHEGLNLKLTASFGVASFPEDATGTDELIQKADNAMYRVKNSTKNSVSEA